MDFYIFNIFGYFDSKTKKGMVDMKFIFLYNSYTNNVALSGNIFNNKLCMRLVIQMLSIICL